MSTEKEYNSDSIKVLRGLDAVRVRPGMYIGDTDDGSGLHHMVFEVVDNAIDEALAGYCSCIKVKIHQDGSVSVSDNGRGIPTDIHPEEGVSAAEVIMTVLHAGGKFDDNSYKVSGGLHGVGVSVVNALSDKLKLTIYRHNKVHSQEYQSGEPVEPLKVIGDTEKTGTTVHFWPSPSIFAITEFKYEILANRLRELSFLNSGVNIELYDERDGRKDIFHYEGGLTEFIKFINKAKPVINDNPFDFTCIDEKTNIAVEIALQWTETYKENVLCFTNNIPQKDGGTHLTGFKSSLTRVVTTYAEKEVFSKIRRGKKDDLKIEGDDIREGLTAIISVKVPDPKFSSQTKEKLVSSEVGAVVSQTVLDKLSCIFEEQPKLASAIIDKVINAARSRVAARKARELTRETRTHVANPHKLVHCTSRNPLNSELYLVEGDSAGGSAVKARDVNTQAILPLRGKILNVERARLEKILESNEIINIIATLKCGIGSEDFNFDNLRYHKIVIMTDADVDGSHIRTLLLTFFFRHMPRLIEEGKVYIAQPPLFKVVVDRKPIYLKNLDEYNKYLIEYALNNIKLKVADKIYGAEVLKDLCERYNQFSEFLNSTQNKFSPEIMKALLYYPELINSTLDNKEELEVWVQGLIKLLERMNDKSVRYEAKVINSSQESKYQINFNVIKHGITETFYIDNFFIDSRSYSDLVKLNKDIDKIMPINGDLTQRFIVKQDTYTPIHYFEHFVEALLELATNKLKPSRYKGLGEMNWEELEETTMKASNRTLLKVNIQDAIEADSMFSILLGDDVNPRREFINENAIYANIDL